MPRSSDLEPLRLALAALAVGAATLGLLLVPIEVGPLPRVAGVVAGAGIGGGFAGHVSRARWPSAAAIVVGPTAAVGAIVGHRMALRPEDLVVTALLVASFLLVGFLAAWIGSGRSG